MSTRLELLETKIRFENRNEKEVIAQRIQGIEGYAWDHRRTFAIDVIQELGWVLNKKNYQGIRNTWHLCPIKPTTHPFNYEQFIGTIRFQLISLFNSFDYSLLNEYYLSRKPKRVTKRRVSKSEEAA